MNAEPLNRFPRPFRSLWIAFMVLATSLPYLVNWLSTSPGFHYTWIIPPYPEDSLGYMAWSQQAAHGSLLFKIKYTALPHGPFLFHPLFLLCGFVSALLHCDIGIVHFLAKEIGVILFFVVFFRYTDYLELTPRQSAIATVLVSLSSGWGWLLLKLGLTPGSAWFYSVDLTMPESSTFWSLRWNPLFPFSLALLVRAIHLLDRGTKPVAAPLPHTTAASRQTRLTGASESFPHPPIPIPSYPAPVKGAATFQTRDLWWSGVCVGLLALIHPYQVPMLFAYATLIIVFRTRITNHQLPITCPGSLLRFFTPALPFALYTLLVAKFHPIAAMHGSAGQMTSPFLTAYAYGFGIPLLLALAGLAVDWRRLVPRYWPVLLWVFLSLSFAYLPFWFQTKFIFGVHVALCILAGISADWLIARIQPVSAPKSPITSHQSPILAGAALLLLPLAVSTQCHLLVAEKAIVRENAEGVYYINTETLDALNYLKQNSQPNDIVFAPLPTSQLIPVFSGNTVVWGHWAMTVDAEQRTEWVNRVFDPQSGLDPEMRRREFWGADIRYIFATGDLKQWFDQLHPAWLTQGMDKVFENSSVTIYRKM